jgi:hypothetical protein
MQALKDAIIRRRTTKVINRLANRKLALEGPNMVDCSMDIVAKYLSGADKVSLDE